MTDKDILDRMQSLSGLGSRKEMLLPSGKTAFGWSITNQRDAAGFMMLLTLMGERRSAKIRHCLSEWKKKPLPKAMWSHCKSGHELSGGNLKIITEGKYDKRRCVECGRLRQEKYRRGVASRVSPSLTHLG